MRPLATAPLVCPVDGAVSQCGAIEGDRVFQAKGHTYSTTALVGGDVALAARFADGHFATIYLSPRDYHRIHMPCDGQLTRMIHVPGTLFSVNPVTAQHVPGLFARNERVVCVFDSAHGPFVMVLVGATIVGSMATVWHGVVNPPRAGALEGVALRRRRGVAAPGRRDGAIPSWLHRRGALAARACGISARLAGGATRPHGRADVAVSVSRCCAGADAPRERRVLVRQRATRSYAARTSRSSRA